MSTGKSGTFRQRLCGKVINYVVCIIVQGRALLGTPNGAGVAWYIAQHTDEIGRRLTVSKGKVFRTQSNGVDYVNILFYIVPLR